MAFYNDYSDFPDQSPQGKTYNDYSDFPDQPGSRPQQPTQPKGIEPSWGQWLIASGLRTVPAVLGGLGGAFMGGPIGAAALGAGSGALGEAWAQMYEESQGLRDEMFNPASIAIEGGLNAIPFFGKFPGVGATAKEFTKFARRAPLSGAAQGAFQGAVGAYPRRAAETGEWGEMPTSEEVLYGGLGGGIFGGGTGLLGTYKGMKAAKGVPPPVESAPPPPFKYPKFEPESPATIDYPESFAPPPPPPPTPPPSRPPDFSPSGPGVPFNYATPEQQKLGSITAIEANTQQKIAELELEKVYATRANDRAAVEQIEQEILEVRLDAIAARRNLSASQAAMPSTGVFDAQNIQYPQGPQPPPPPPQNAPMPTPGMTVPSPDMSVEAGPRRPPLPPSGSIPVPPPVGGNKVPFVPPTEIPPALPGESIGSYTRRTGLRNVYAREAMAKRDTPVEEMTGEVPTAESELPPGVPPTPTNIRLAEMVRESKLGIAPPVTEGTVPPTQPNLLPEQGPQPVVILDRPTSAKIKFYTDQGYILSPESNVKQAILVLPEAAAEHGVTTSESPFARAMKAKQAAGLMTDDFEELPTETSVLRTQSGLRNISQAVPGQVDLGPTPRIQDFEPQEMRVPGVREGKGGLENVAMGGASPRVLDVMGSSLYNRERPVVVVKELLQNSFDEHKRLGINEPVRVLIDAQAKNPQGGADGKSITVRDRGEGLAPDEIYTVFTNLGETGKEGVESAAGGFGFAKAAPFLGGKYVTVHSVVDTPQGRMKYTFSGNPAELKNQVKGVAFHAEQVSKNIPTGLEVSVFYDADIPGFYKAATWAENMTKNSPSVSSGILLAETYGAPQISARKWLDEGPNTRIKASDYNYVKEREEAFTAEPTATLMDTISVPGSEVKIHYDIPPAGRETSQAKLHLMNKGMYQGTQEISYGEQTANVPHSIVADINAVVEEGHADYPFSVNREQINDNVTHAINKWVRDNIVTGVIQKRVREIQKMYDGIGLLHDGQNEVHFIDSDGLLTPDEVKFIAEHPKMIKVSTVLESVHKKMLEVADSLGWSPEVYGASWVLPSQRLKKFGLLFKAPDSNGTTLGIHIPRPDDMNNSAIMINLAEQLNDAIAYATNTGGDAIDSLVTSLFTTIAHEQAHIPGGVHDKGHSYRDAALRAKLGEMNTVGWLEELREAMSDGKGGISPELSEILSVYNESRLRTPGGPNAIVATGISSQRQPNTGGGENSNAGGAGGGEIEPSAIKPPEKPKPTTLRQLYNLPRAITTILDLSATLRQGLPLVFTKEWRKAWKPMLEALGSEGAYQKSLQDIKNREMFKRRPLANGREEPSLAEKGGVKILDTSTGDYLEGTEEAFATDWVETGGMFGKNNPVQRAYKNTLGRAARASNRAYQAFLNQLRADTFETLVRDAMRLYDVDLKVGGKSGARNPLTDMDFLRQIGDFVNTATGRGPLKLARPTFVDGKLAYKEANFERSVKGLTDAIFSPRLFFAHMRMMNPATYMMASPFVRKQYMKSALSVASAWTTVAGIASMAGADVSMDTNSADFGKIRIGDTRIDPAGGFQQYLVTLSRLLTGKTTSSSIGQEFELGQGFRAETRGDVAHRFLGNKLHPVVKFAHDMAFSTQYQPFHVTDRTLQMYVPLIVQDVLELAEENPELLPLIAPVGLGMGTQTYGKGESVSKFVPPEKDWIFRGGSPRWPF